MLELGRRAVSLAAEHAAMKPNWSRRFPNPIRLADGTVLRTLRDAADWIIDHQPPGSDLAAIPRLMEAAGAWPTQRPR